MTPEPTYPQMRQGPVVVVGGGANALEDLVEAHRSYGVHPVCGINFISELIEVDYIVSAHTEMLGSFGWRHHLRTGKRAETHGVDQNAEYRALMRPEYVDYRWKGGAKWRGGSSSLCAALVMRAIGHEPVILCGCPMEKIGYADGYPVRVGSEFYPDSGKNATIESWHARWAEARDLGLLKGVVSMSGFTKRLLDGKQRR